MTKVVEGAKDTGYSLVIVAALCGVAACAWAIYSMLASDTSPWALFDRASADLANDPVVQKYLGSNIHTFGERSRGGRQVTVQHAAYTNDAGQQCMRLAFHAKGDKCAANAFAEFVLIQNEYAPAALAAPPSLPPSLTD